MNEYLEYQLQSIKRSVARLHELEYQLDGIDKTKSISSSTAADVLSRCVRDINIAVMKIKELNL